MTATGSPAWESRLAQGRRLWARGRIADAETAFCDAVRLAPAAPAALEEHARLLAELGRWPEAAAQLRKALALKDHSIGAYMTLGRILTGKGQLDEAESVYRRALRRGCADKTQLSAAHEVLGRLHQRMGHPDEARDDFSRAVELDAKSSSPFSGLAAVLRTLGDAPGARKALEKALRLSPKRVEPRALKIQLLMDDGEASSAITEARAVLASLDAIPSNQRVQCIAALSDVLGALLCDGRYGEAARFGEALADDLMQRAPPSFLIGFLLWPWARKVGRSVAEPRFCGEQQALIAAAEKAEGLDRWFVYWRCLLLIAMGKHEEALRERGALACSPADRFSWMRLPFILCKLGQRDFADVIEDCRVVLQQRPDLWWARCRLAEATLAQGEFAAGRRELELAEKIARSSGDAESTRSVLTWHGEVLLWLGEYERALLKLDEAVRSGAAPFANGWRGAALLKLGRVQEAMDALDGALQQDPKDLEALLWRGEARRISGAREQALEDLDLSVIRMPSGHPWAHINRALVRHALQDDRGMSEDLAKVPPDMMGFFRAKCGFTRERVLTASETAAMLCAGLELAKGVRRPEAYVQSIWMR
jgi:tetratricopeptide (TPR) repeat protein